MRYQISNALPHFVNIWVPHAQRRRSRTTIPFSSRQMTETKEELRICVKMVSAVWRYARITTALTNTKRGLSRWIASLKRSTRSILSRNRTPVEKNWYTGSYSLIMETSVLMMGDDDFKERRQVGVYKQHFFTYLSYFLLWSVEARPGNLSMCRL